MLVECVHLQFCARDIDRKTEASNAEVAPLGKNCFVNLQTCLADEKLNNMIEEE